MTPRAAVCCLAFAATTAWAYWAPTPIEQLAANSDCVVIGRVTKLTPNTNTYRVLVSFDVLSVIKGQRHAGASVTFDAPFTLIHDVFFNGPDGKQLPPGLYSFTTNETCAVFLRCNPHDHAALMLERDDDGKFTIDLAASQLWRPIMAGGGVDGPQALSLDTFTKLVHAGDKRPPNTVQIFTANNQLNSPAGFWAPTPIEALAAESDCVVIGRIQQLVPATNQNRVTVMMDELFVLKGFEHAGKTVTFDAPLNMSYCHPFNSCTSNETCAAFLKFSREKNPRLALVRDNDGKFDMDWSMQHLQRANLKLKVDDGENSLSLKEFRRKVEATVSPHLPTVADMSRPLSR